MNELKLVKGYMQYSWVDSTGTELARVFAVVGSCNRTTGRWGYQIGEQRPIWNARYTDLKDLILKVRSKIA